MKNDFVEYYGKHNISPVRQDISDIELHYERRKKLYRQCGIPTIAFRNAKVLEVGPGGGYNTLALFHWGINHVDLVEANPTGRNDMEKLFADQGIARDKYDIFPCKIEDYQTDEKYDIIIAEGFVQNLYNQMDVINKLKNLVAENGIVVITCTDSVCWFIELMKRLVGQTLAANITEYDQKVEYLADLFAPQLSKLRGVSRYPKDWVQDQILDSPNVNGIELTLRQAIDYFENEFDILGCSPQMFTDYSWCKDVWYDYKEDYREQFSRKRLSLLMASMPEIIASSKEVSSLVNHFDKIRCYEADYEKTYENAILINIINEMKIMEENLNKNLDDSFMKVFNEIKDVLERISEGKDIDMGNYPHFFEAFGRTQQYISFVKNNFGSIA